jgi:Family of unknown function (DUF6186)
MSTRAITVAGFVAIIAALVVLELLGRRPASRIPTVGEWLGYVMRPRTGRALILLGWVWLGWHYFARLARRPEDRAARPAQLAPDRTHRQLSLSYAA